MELKLCAITGSIIFGLFLLIPSVNMHELGHAVACVGQGFELFEINFLASYVRCSDSGNQLVDIMGGATGSISMLLFIFERVKHSHHADGDPSGPNHKALVPCIFLRSSHLVSSMHLWNRR